MLIRNSQWTRDLLDELAKTARFLNNNNTVRLTPILKADDQDPDYQNLTHISRASHFSDDTLHYKTAETGCPRKICKLQIVKSSRAYSLNR